LPAKKRKKTEPLLKVSFILLTILLAMRLGASFFPETRLWGFNHAAFVRGMPWLYIALFFLAWLAYRGGIAKPVRISSGESAGPPAAAFRKPYPYLIILIFTAAFYIFSVESRHLGDGYQLISYLSKPNLALKAESFGDMKIHQLLSHELGDGSQVAVYNSFLYVSVLSGLIFVFSLLYYGRKIAGTVFGYYSFVLLNFLSAFALLFFGYVETYSIVTVVLFLFLLSGLSSVLNRKRSAVPIVAYIIAVFLHRISIVFLPALLVYLFFSLGGPRMRHLLESKSRIFLAALTTIILAAYALILIAGPIRLTTVFLSPLPNRFTVDGYFLVSPAHLIDFLNLLAFVIPVAIFVFILRKALPSASDIRTDRAPATFLFTGAMVGMAAAFLIEPKLGMARDWDLMSTMLIGAQVAGTYFWISGYESHRQFRPATIILLILCLSVFIPWLALHNSPMNLNSYALSVMKLDPKHSRSGLVIMIDILKSHGKHREAEKIREFCSHRLTEDIYLKKGEAYLAESNFKAAEIFFRKAIDENPSYYFSYLSLARMQIDARQYQKALENLEISDALNPYNSDNWYCKGMAHSWLEDGPKAYDCWRKSIHYDALNPLPYMALSESYFADGEMDSSLYYYIGLPDTVDIFPVVSYYRLGRLGLGLGETAKALHFFSRYESAGQDTVLLREIKEIKADLED
jgi:hypothetical protein